VGLGASLDRCGKSHPTGIQSPDLPASSESLYQLSYPSSTVQYIYCIFSLLYRLLRIRLKCQKPLLSYVGEREREKVHCKFYVLLTVHLDAILGNDQLDALFLNVFILCLYMFQAASAYHQEVQIVLIHRLV
jgi:hypothetical protein